MPINIKQWRSENFRKNLWSHRFSQNTYQKLSEFLPFEVRAEISTIFFINYSVINWPLGEASCFCGWNSNRIRSLCMLIISFFCVLSLNLLTFPIVCLFEAGEFSLQNQFALPKIILSVTSFSKFDSRTLKATAEFWWKNVAVQLKANW